MKKLLPLLIVVITVICTSAIIYGIVYCHKNPQAATCQPDNTPMNTDSDFEGEDCDHDDSVAKGDMECIGIPGKEGTSTRKPVTTKTLPNKGNTINTKVRK